MKMVLGQTTVKRRKKSTAAPNPKKMFEESQMVRRVKAYLNNLRVVTDEAKLHEMSLDCEGKILIGVSKRKTKDAILKIKLHFNW